MHAPNHSGHHATSQLTNDRVSHAARIQLIARDRRDLEPVNHEGHRQITAARLAASGGRLST